MASKNQPATKRSSRFKLKEPSKYHVIMHNDDVTTMDFVVMILERIFCKTKAEAETIMLKIHHEGSAIVGTYYRDIAVSKKDVAIKAARDNGFPLQLTVEEEAL